MTAKNDWHIGREDGTFDGLADKMWNVLRTKRHGCR